jgi:hypothetical protein
MAKVNGGRMKRCADCGQQFEDQFDECPECAIARYESSDEVPLDYNRRARSESGTEKAIRSRPTGEYVLLGGAAFFLVGLIVVFSSEPYSQAFFAGLALLNMGLLGLVTGYIVYAISFLRGQDG